MFFSFIYLFIYFHAFLVIDFSICFLFVISSDDWISLIFKIARDTYHYYSHASTSSHYITFNSQHINMVPVCVFKENVMLLYSNKYVVRSELYILTINFDLVFHKYVVIV